MSHVDEMAGHRRTNWIAAILLVGLCIGAHYDVVFLGRSLIYSNYFNPLDYRALPDNYGPDFVPHEKWIRRNLSLYANLRDPSATWWQWEPSTAFLAQAIRTGEWPLWDPYVAAGTPAMANLIPAFFFPPYLAVVVLGASSALKNAYFLALIWSAAFFTYLFLRRHGVTALAGFIGAAIVLFGGGLNQNLGSFMGQTAACLPVAAYATRALLDRPTSRRLAMVSVVYASVALASFPPLLVAIFGIVTIYAGVAIAVEQPTPAARVRVGAWWAGAALLSIGLVAFYYGPALALRHEAPHVEAFYRGVALETMPMTHILQLLSPTVLGGVPVYARGPFSIQTLPHIPYIGAAAVLCALLARASQDRRSRTLWISSGVAAVISLCTLFGVPPVQWIAYFRPFDEIHMAYYFGIPLFFLGATLAALGVDGLLAARLSLRRTLASAVLIIVAVEALRRLASSARAFEAPVGVFLLRDWKFLALVTVASSIAAVVAVTSCRTRRQRQCAIACLLALAIAEGVYNNSYPHQRRWDIFEHPVPFIGLLRHEASAGRVLSFGAPNANLNEAFEVSGVDSLMAFNPPRMFDLYKHYTGAAPGIFMRGARQIPPEAVLDRANVSFIGINKAYADIFRAAAVRNHRLRFDDGFIAVFQRETLPRFLFSSAYSVMSKPAALLAIGTEPPRTIVVETPPAFPSTPNVSTDPAIIVEANRRNATVLKVDAPRAGFVYIADSFFSGWTARVNGRPAAIAPANYAFRAIEVPAGPARIELRYWPPGLTAGLTGTGVSALLLLTLAWGPRRALTFGKRRPSTWRQATPDAISSGTLE